MQLQKKHILSVLFVGIALVLLCLWFFLPNARHAVLGQGGSASTTLHTFTLEELAKYDGSSTTLPIYIGLDGYVFDVSAGKKFYVPGATYHYLAGNDSSKSLHIMGGEIIKQKYPIVGILEK